MTREEITQLWAYFVCTRRLEAFLNKAAKLHPDEYTATIRAIWYAFDVARSTTR